MIDLFFVGIDPATETGLVEIGEDGKLIGWIELKAIGKTPAARLNDNLNNIYRLLKRDSKVCIEGFALEAKFDTGKVSSGFNWAARLAIDRKVGQFDSATPNQLKNFVSVAEWEPDPERPGRKRKLEGKEVKRRVQAAVEAHWGHKPPTSNIADAYVLARISEALWRLRQGQRELGDYPDYQRDVLHAILDPAGYKAAKEATKGKRGKRGGV
ncbi:hypothetical protein [Paenibacillus sp. GCM10012303]|uniref:hypothetical protein n=1 Tax=Paenibacillus sp. GCM10012303 TaxID=3317340 RepID=UPI003622E249